MSKIKLNLVGLGGTGINILYRTKMYMDDLKLKDQGLADVKYFTSDASSANQHKADALGAKIHKIEDTKIGGNDIVGNGTIRGNNISVVSDGVVDFLNESGITDNGEGNNFTLLIHSASGATGSVVAPLIAKELLARDANFAVVIIGDSTNHHLTNNTIDTLQSFHNIAKKANKNISMHFRDNALHEKNSEVDQEVVSFITTMAMFVSGQNEQLDTADMGVFFKPHMLAKKFDIPSGVSLMGHYSASAYTPEKDEQYVMTRVLTANSDDKVNVPSLSNRQGKVINEQLLEVLDGADNLPLVMFSNIGELGAIMDRLKKTAKGQELKFKGDELEVTDDDLVF